VLDLGCGGGDPVALALKAHGLKVTGIEGSPTLISPRKASGSPWA
jgi:2-polyprenyl-3-methyl-5-hydroxy-6-metoxy-1,4-benzoquinol methylase